LKNGESGPGLAFKSGGRCAAFVSKENCSLETYLAGLKISKIIPGQFSKALGAATRNLFSNRSKGIELAAF
jgi:hypothetical protein